jgi:EAL domain-containing protein (putative c-di-GMP-specific phosphodiesterase class I)
MSDYPPPVPSHYRIASRVARSGPRKETSRLLDKMESLIEISDGRATVPFNGLTLETAFQPVISLAHGRPIGYETLLRARDDDQNVVSPLDVFSAAIGRGEATFLDGLCRALHLRNFEQQGVADAWLFVNLNPRALMEGDQLGPLVEGLLDRHQLPAHRVVVEIIETTTFDERHLADAVAFFRELGCLIAIDDFGAGQSNFERVWRMAPDIVKLDRSMLTEATRSPRVRRILPGLATLIHEAGCLVVMEGIESEEQALIAMEMDVDFVQGFFFGRPEPQVEPVGDLYRRQLDDLFDRFRNRVTEEIELTRTALEGFTEALQTAAARVVTGADAKAVIDEFAELAGVERCYVLNESGTQIASSLGSRSWQSAPDPRYEPLAETGGSNWMRRPYFRRAITHPMHVHVSRPYLSTQDARTCVTLSIAVQGRGRVVVLCADLDWETSDTALLTPSWRPPMITLSDIK